MSQPIDLGRTCLCLKVADVDDTAAFYEKLGFRSTGEDAPKQRRSLIQGATILTFRNFLPRSLINYRGASIHALVTELKARGLAILGHNTGPELQLMLDDDGNPLPDNECGFFTVFDPDGNEIFFNTHPPEREPYEDGRWVPQENLAADIQNTATGEGVLGRFLYRLDVRDLEACIAFYENLGLSVLGSTADSATMGSRHPHMEQDPTSFPISLRRAKESGSALLFCCEDPDAVADSIRTHGLQVVPSQDGLVVTDPDQRSLLLVAADRNPILT